MAVGEWDGLLGIRRDIDLNQRWWHRLAKVLYFVILGLVIMVFGISIWDESQRDGFPAQRSQVEVIVSLDDVLTTSDESVPNVVPLFLKREGRLGYDDGSGTLDSMYDFELEDTLCSPEPLKHTEFIAAFLNAEYNTTRNTSENIASGILQTMKAGDAKNICWKQQSARTKEFSKVIKYEFTTLGFVSALWDYSFPYIGWMAGIHVVLLNIYYRGMVFVIVGPRRKVTPPRGDDDVDADDT